MGNFPKNVLNIAKLDEAFAAGKLDDNPYLPVFQVMRAGLCTVTVAFQGGADHPMQPFDIPQGTLPFVLIVGDDMPGAGGSRGPTQEAFDLPSLEKAVARCDRVLLQVAAFIPNVMFSIALAAAAGASTTVIECADHRELEWLDWLLKRGKRNILVVSPQENRSKH